MLSNNQLVNFLICGTQKGGTTALDSYLRQHPNICMANEKEVHFFDNDEYFESHPPNYSTYHSAFTPLEYHEVVGETTPIYMYWKNSPQRIFQYNPKMKLILLLRNPIERAYSHWNMERKRGNEKRPFLAALEHEKSLDNNPSRTQHRIISYIDRGYYTRQITTIKKYFPNNQILILSSHKLKQNPKSTLMQVYRFIGVPEFFSFNYTETVHSIPYDTPLSEIEKKYLLNLFREEIHKLEALLGWNCSEWLK